jgi:hypothetical protein
LEGLQAQVVAAEMEALAETEATLSFAFGAETIFELLPSELTILARLAETQAPVLTWRLGERAGKQAPAVVGDQVYSMGGARIR